MYISAMRLIILFLISVFAMPITEAARQSVGYVILVLHGLSMIGFLIKHSWQVYKTILRGTPVDQTSSTHSTSGESDLSNSFHMDSLETHSTADLLEYHRRGQEQQALLITHLDQRLLQQFQGHQ
ncbi:hypothetical protein FVER53263_21042 [Fusarium verticillioides]|nr:hypothetical protein FVER53263_21042 [Fusarium verticillioides]